MSDNSGIEWTNATWNPVRGCTKISPGCKHCYAETFAERFRGVRGHPYEQGFDLRLVPEALELPLRWKKPRRVFVNSMSDLFHEQIPEVFVQDVFSVMRSAAHHTFQVLTKRPERMRRLLKGHEVPPNVWVGVSVESAKYTWRIDELRQVVASTRFLSVEPLLGPLGELDLAGIAWVIVGGESGRHPRAMDADWVRSVRDQCRSKKVAFFFKQWGGKNKKAAGRVLDGRTWDEFPDEVAELIQLRPPRRLSSAARIATG